MESALETMNAQIEAWAAGIEALASGYRRSGVPLRFDTVMYLDELKGLHVIARSSFDDYRAAAGQRRDDLEPAMKVACEELADALARRPRS